MAHIIKRFPFVRGVFISGDLSKGVADAKSDIDYVIVTEPKRLWICRTLLILFKKVFLFNQKKYFCLNYFVASDNLVLEDHNYFTATEIAHLKPLYNFNLYMRYMNANRWIKIYFPNFTAFAFGLKRTNNRPSIIQPFIEYLFRGSRADRLENRLMTMMKGVWQKRYPQYDQEARERLFRCSPHESRAYVGNFADKVLNRYSDRLAAHDIRDSHLIP